MIFTHELKENGLLRSLSTLKKDFFMFTCRNKFECLNKPYKIVIFDYKSEKKTYNI